MDDIDDYPDYPKRTEDMSIWDFQDQIKKYFQLKDLKHNDDFSDDEKNAIIEDCTVNMIGRLMMVVWFHSESGEIQWFFIS